MIFNIGKKSKTVTGVKSVRGTIEVNSDKSISHRSIIFASLAEGVSEINNFLFAEDCLNTLNIFKKMGVSIKKQNDGSLVVEGNGRYGLRQPKGNLYCGNSATTMRLMSGVLSAQKFSSELTGDDSLSKRPMSRVTVPLTKMGARITVKNGEYPPVKIRPGIINGINYKSPVASAQVKSCILLAGLYSDDTTSVTEPYKSRDHTERMMEYFGIPVSVKKNTVTLERGGLNWPGKSLTVPGDFSSAAFFITAALIIPGSRIEIQNVNLNPTRTGLLNLIKNMGGNVKVTGKKNICGEPVGNITAQYSQLKSSTVTPADIPGLIDEVPLAALLASRAEGKTVIEGAGELRKKETDRLHAVSTQLQNMGQTIHENRDSLIIEGRRGGMRSARVESCGDHRMAMMLSIAGLLAKGTTVIDDVKCVNTSFPDFFKILEKVSER